MLESLRCAGCGVLIGIGLVFLGMGRISERYGDDCGAGVASVIFTILFLLAVIVLWMI